MGREADTDHLRMEGECRDHTHMEVPSTDRLRDEKGVPIDSLWKVIRRRIQSGEPVILSVGLRQPFNGIHWLGADNIHFRDYFDDHPVFRFAR